MLINSVEGHKLVFKQVEYCVDFVFGNAETRVFYLKLDELSLLNTICRCVQMGIVAFFIVKHLLFGDQSFDLKFNKAVLSVLLRVHKHIDDNSN